SQQITIPETEVDRLEREAVASLNGGAFNVEQLVNYQVMKKQEDLLGLQRKAYVAEYYPSLSLNGNYMYNSQSDKFNLYTSSALNYDMAGVTLNLRIPIFDGNARRAKIRQADVELQKIHEDLRNTSNALTMAYE